MIILSGYAMLPVSSSFFFFFNDTATTEIYTLSLHDALPIYPKYKAFTALDPFFDIVKQGLAGQVDGDHYFDTIADHADRSEEHTSELQSPCNLVCRLLLEKKKDKRIRMTCPSPRQCHEREPI